jgi:hypothetical protein
MHRAYKKTCPTGGPSSEGPKYRQIGSTLVSRFDTISWMSKKHRRTLAAIFADPVRANVNWSDIEAMLVAYGAEISEGKGSRVRLALNGS